MGTVPCAHADCLDCLSVRQRTLASSRTGRRRRTGDLPIIGRNAGFLRPPVLTAGSADEALAQLRSTRLRYSLSMCSWPPPMALPSWSGH